MVSSVKGYEFHRSLVAPRKLFHQNLIDTIHDKNAYCILNTVVQKLLNTLILPGPKLNKNI